MLPWKTIIRIDKSGEMPVYLQLANAVITEIKDGVIRPGTKMPGTRAMSSALGINRQTVVRGYDELYAQGWITYVQSKGTFISEKLPEVSPRKFVQDGLKSGYPKTTGYSF